MMRSSHLRWSFFALFTLVLAVFLASCSKKDVVSDEAGFSPTEGLGGGDAAAAPGGEGAVSAGEAGGGVANTPTEMQTVYYEFDSFRLTSEGRNALTNAAQYMKSNPSVTVQIEGHCDERGTTEYNVALGERRANSAKDYLVRQGVDAGRLSVISYGEERPAVMGSDESAWAQNRRASFVILTR